MQPQGRPLRTGTILGNRYVDGGVYSGTSADAVIDLSPDLVVVIAPITAGTASFGALADQLRAAMDKKNRK